MTDRAATAPPRVTCRPFGRTATGETVEVFTLTNGTRCSVDIATYGATVTAIRVPDARGEIDDIVLGFDSLDGYLGSHPYFGATIGRCANRIARGRFHLDGHEYVLACNNGPNHLHGGARGFDRHVWRAATDVTEDTALVRLSRTSPAGEEGYPGNLDCTVTYTLTAANELRIDYAAATDRPTIVNLTHHSYFNLAGKVSEGALDHRLFVNADEFLPVDETQIPTGERRSVEGSAFDLRRPTAIGAANPTTDAQLSHGRGFDHNYVLRKSPAPSRLTLAARVHEPLSGRSMEVTTTEPGLQVYAGGFLDGTICGKGGCRYGRHAAFCLEPQHFPDAPNQPGFASTQLSPGDTYRSSTIYRFSTYLQLET